MMMDAEPELKEQKPLPPIVADAHALYLAFGGRQHRRIEEAMRAKGYTKFSRRVFYDRYERGHLTLGWMRRYGWNVVGSNPPALVCGMTRPNFPPVTENKAKSLNPAPIDQTGPSETNEMLKENTDETEQQKATFISGSESNSASPTPDVKPANTSPKQMEQFQKWLKRIAPNMQWDAAHQQYLYSKLDDITSGRSKRLMIFMPPRHGKSELVSVRYAAWRLRQDPTMNIILGSYSQRLANRFSRKIRTTWEEAGQIENGQLRIENKEDKSGKSAAGHGTKSRSSKTQSAGTSSTNAASDNSQLSTVNSQSSSTRSRLNTASEWETGLGGGVRAVGVGAGITGFGANLIIIDDPVKSRAEAESETFRNRAWEWFNDDIYTRLEPNASIILIQTRWHEDDLSGRLLQEMQDGGEKWDIVCLPAIAEATDNGQLQPIDNGQLIIDNEKPSSTVTSKDITQNSPAIINCQLSIINCPDPLGRNPGDALWPERFPVPELLRIKRQMGTYSFSALYQQRPVPLEGGLFKKSWFAQIIPVPPHGLRWFRGYDLAISTKTSADYTASARCAIDRQGNIYIADVYRARLEYPDQRKFVIDRMTKERDTEHGIEAAMHAQAFIQDLRRMPGLARFAIKPVRVISDKFTRALAWANRAEEGKIILVRGPWIHPFLDEVCSFPNSPHDDQVDAVSLCVQMMEARKRMIWRF